MLINIQMRLQATRDAASCVKQIAIPLAQRITLWFPLCLLTFWRENYLSLGVCDIEKKLYLNIFWDFFDNYN